MSVREMEDALVRAQGDLTAAFELLSVQAGPKMDQSSKSKKSKKSKDYEKFLSAEDLRQLAVLREREKAIKRRAKEQAKQQAKQQRIVRQPQQQLRPSYGDREEVMPPARVVDLTEAYDSSQSAPAVRPGNSRPWLSELEPEVRNRMARIDHFDYIGSGNFGKTYYVEGQGFFGVVATKSDGSEMVQKLQTDIDVSVAKVSMYSKPSGYLYAPRVNSGYGALWPRQPVSEGGSSFKIDPNNPKAKFSVAPSLFEARKLNRNVELPLVLWDKKVKHEKDATVPDDRSDEATEYAIQNFIKERNIKQGTNIYWKYENRNRPDQMYFYKVASYQGRLTDGKGGLYVMRWLYDDETIDLTSKNGLGLKFPSKYLDDTIKILYLHTRALLIDVKTWEDGTSRTYDFDESGYGLV